MRSTLTVAGLAAALVAGTPAAALAASSDGATQMNFHDCTTVTDSNTGDLITRCMDSVGQFNTTTTPSGNTSLEAHFTASQTYTSVSFSDTNTADVNEHHLFKQGQEQELSLHEVNTVDIAGGTTCTTTYDVHYANGQYQFDNITTVC